jgi:hypothetical protein
MGMICIGISFSYPSDCPASAPRGAAFQIASADSRLDSKARTKPIPFGDLHAATILSTAAWFERGLV